MSKVDTWSLNDLFQLPEEDEGGISQIRIDKLVSFSNHPFKLYEGERLNDMIDSIKEHGIITPIIVRPLENEIGMYEILSGHNRVNAGKKAGLESVPSVIKENLSDEEAMLIVTETNLIQRSFSELSHSEKAKILSERHKAMKDQGKRSDIISEIEILSNTDGIKGNSTSYQFDKKLETRTNVAEKYDLSPANVSRYLRIDKLTDELKIRLDNNEIPFIAGVNLSHLKPEEQEDVEKIIKGYDLKVDLKKSDLLKGLSKRDKLTYEKVYDILSGELEKKPKKKPTPKFSSKFTKETIEKYTSSEIDIKDLEGIIEKLLETRFTKMV